MCVYGVCLHELCVSTGSRVLARYLQEQPAVQTEAEARLTVATRVAIDAAAGE